ncbi:hypothetical protein CEXT_44711 [Caerostris extrusa]|uniref:Uncharacterized protein n=1 Tax=Caerostris extrusa TaxID=172846 RepID=A0AAV4TQP9_CAEEX|nr:hypothetical protein CEXT_44711 [Caerostris extrusa]
MHFSIEIRETQHRWFSGRKSSPATRAARVRFPADARFLSFFSQLAELLLTAKFPRCDDFSVETLETQHRWFSGRMLACHAAARVRFPADARFFIFFNQLAERFSAVKFPSCDPL